MATVPCPTCQRPVEWSAASPFRPFCSERCKLIDLGAWMTERRAIPGEELPQPADGEGGPPEERSRH
ncbi:MAG: DNA gyrase inhibitor YacG [Gammaproteobacteria bacterium]|nr:DNA gyrase inhibitor YacG [Gammaproteobacteria bacterium]